MARYEILPTELWDSIFCHLLLPDLEAANAASRYFHQAVQHALIEHRALHREASALEPDFPWRCQLVPWLGPLLRVLRDPRLAFYVTEFDTAAHYSDKTLASFREDNPQKIGMQPLPPVDMALLLQAAETCYTNWIHVQQENDLRDNFFRDVRNFEQSALLAIMMCNFPNLRVLKLTAGCYGGMEDMEWVTKLVTHAYESKKSQNPGIRPFSRLEHLKGDLNNCFYGLDLESIAPFLALPSLLWVETPQNHEEGFDWEPTLPRSNVREIVLDQSSVTEEAIRKFAAEALRGPCVIRQAWCRRRDPPTPNPTWNRLVVPFEGAKPEDHIVEFNKKSDPYFKSFDSMWYSDIGWEVRGGGKLLGRPVTPDPFSDEWDGFE